MPPTLIGDQIIFIKYGEAIIEYRKKRQEKIAELEQASGKDNGKEFQMNYDGIILPEISDRRVCWASQMMEVSAVTAGRIQVLPEDMIACHYILGTSDIEKDIWVEIVNKKVLEINEMKKNKLSDLQLTQLTHLRDAFEDLKSDGHDTETKANGIATLVRQISDVKPENTAVSDLLNSLIKDAEQYKVTIREQFLKEKGLD